MPSDVPARTRQLRQAAVLSSWATTPNRTARTAPARRAFEARFEREVDPDGALLPEERARRAAAARRAYFKRLAVKSADARTRRRP